MLDTFGREINYLRISVIDRCNLRCQYCMPEHGIKLISHADILSFEEIVEIVKVAVELGITKVRLTGGEPLIRRNIVTLVEKLAAIQDINDLALTTNGILLADFAQKLRDAGLKRINISLDTIDPKRFAEITRGGDVTQVFAGIAAAIAAGFNPIKINCTIKKDPTEADAVSVAAYAKNLNLEVRYIRLMDFQSGTFAKVIGGNGGDCKNCSRLRLLSDGRILPCLFSDIYFSTKKLGIREALLQAIKHKPKHGKPCQREWMCNVGG